MRLREDPAIRGAKSSLKTNNAVVLVRAKDM